MKKELPEYTLRIETEADYRKTENVVREAFWNLYAPGCDEHYLTHVLRGHPDYIPDMAYVAVSGKDVLGCIQFTVSRLESDEGRSIETVSFGPVCVLPEYQRMGIGSALIRKGIEEARTRGFPAITIYGDPSNYCRHGFRNGKDCGISDAEGRFPYALLTLVLDQAKLKGSSWRCRQSEAFNLDREESRKFDAQFPQKEKRETPDQVVFSIQCRAFLDA